MGFLMTQTIMSKEVLQQATEGANIRCLGHLKAGLNYNTMILAHELSESLTILRLFEIASSVLPALQNCSNWFQPSGKLCPKGPIEMISYFAKRMRRGDRVQSTKMPPHIGWDA